MMTGEAVERASERAGAGGGRVRRPGLVVVALAAVAAVAVPPALADEHVPEVLTVVRDPLIVEASGIAADPSGEVLWVIQDAGTAGSEVFAVGPDGESRLVVEVEGVENEDWEDLALGTDEAGAPALFIGDIGDAYFVRRDAGRESRTEYQVVRIARPPVDPDGRDDVVEAEAVTILRFTFADGRTHNAESLLVQPGTNRIYVIDKTERDDQDAFVWVAPERLVTDGVNTLELVGPMPVTGASAASFSPSGDRMVVRDADNAYVWKVEDGDVAAALEREPGVVVLPPQRQGEGVDFLPDGTALVTNSEGGSQAIYRVPLPDDLRTGAVVASTDLPGGEPGGGGFVDDLSPGSTGSPVVVGGAAVWTAALLVGGILWWRRRERT